MKDAYHKEDPAADDTLYILTAAVSNSYYFLDELYGMLAAAGVKAKVCSLYRGSTGINLYYDYWKKGENVFQLIIHDENGVTTLEGMNLDLALKYYNWDVYNMQDGNAPHRQGKTPQAIADERAVAHSEIIAHVRQKCPLAKLYRQHLPPQGLSFERGVGDRFAAVCPSGSGGAAEVKCKVRYGDPVTHFLFRLQIPICRPICSIYFPHIRQPYGLPPSPQGEGFRADVVIGPYKCHSE